ncbi:MAG: EamA family transporter [Acidaminobacter sp.]|uniref:EamA family transporter n=1 Tax=Acidaminobacter sp. TaxID=1872102 RepID=UPI001381B707|nr:EamA family transporter [Acidaminobacter sp.]MZQ96267.1 EamA family transporter [Acidaminobacter sp.]
MPKSNNKELTNWLAYLAVCIFWGSAYVAIKIGVTDIAPLFFTALRFSIAGALMLLYAFLKGIPFPSYPREYVQSAIIGLLILFGGPAFVGLASRYISAGAVSLIVASIPLAVAVMQMIYYPKLRTASLRIWLGLLIGFSGVAILIFAGGGEVKLDLRGVILCLISVVLWSAGTIYSGTVRLGSHMIVQSGLQMFFAGLGILAASFATGENHTLNVSIESLMALLFLIIFGSILAYSAYMHIIKSWPLAKANTYAYINPMVAVLMGWLILSEPITPGILLSMAVILSGVILVQADTSKPQQVLETAESAA